MNRKRVVAALVVVLVAGAGVGVMLWRARGPKASKEAATVGDLAARKRAAGECRRPAQRS